MNYDYTVHPCSLVGQHRGAKYFRGDVKCKEVIVLQKFKMSTITILASDGLDGRIWGRRVHLKTRQLLSLGSISKKCLRQWLLVPQIVYLLRRPQRLTWTPTKSTLVILVVFGHQKERPLKKSTLVTLAVFGHGKERPLKNQLWSLWLSLVIEKRDTKKIHFGCLWSSKRETPKKSTIVTLVVFGHWK